MKPGESSAEDRLRLPPDRLRWRCPPSWVPADSTAELPAATGLEGQVDALEALRFGLESRGKANNVFLAGIFGGGRLQLLRELVEEHRGEGTPRNEYAYVCNFSAPERPRLLRLPAGSGAHFKRHMRKFASYVETELGQALESDAIRLRQDAISRREKEELAQVTEPFKQGLLDAGLELVSVRHEGTPMATPALLPLVDDQPVAPEVFEQMHEDGEVPADRYRAYRKSIAGYQERLAEMTAKVGRIVRESAERRKEVLESPARALLQQAITPILQEFALPEVVSYLGEVIDDVIENRIEGSAVRQFDADTVYGVNLLEPREADGPPPVIVEGNPSLFNLLGGIDATPRNGDPHDHAEHLTVRAGSLLRADGGYLLLDARDLVSEDGSWKLLVRALSSGVLELSPPGASRTGARELVKPDPIPIEVRVVVLGDLGLFRRLETTDPDFRDLFKVLVVLESTLPRDPESVHRYAGVVARLARQEALPPFDRGAIQCLVEAGARLADRPNELSTRFDLIEDISCEAAYLTLRRRAPAVERDDVEQAMVRILRRSDPPARRYRYLLRCGRFNVRTSGAEVGQVNGLALMRSTQLPYGIPARLTATVGPGTAGIVDIENEAALGGSIHTKGFHIFGGVLRRLLDADHPLVLSASVAFEQSYGRIDGDSASAAEACCLLSALAEVPVRQGLAMTGSIDQLGNIQAVGGCNEKVEGFYDACVETGLTGDQGVIVPRSNLGDLMLRPDLVAACERGEFHLYAVSRLEESLELFTGVVAGERRVDGSFPEDSVLGRAAARAKELWRQSTRRQPRPAGVATE